MGTCHGFLPTMEFTTFVTPLADFCRLSQFMLSDDPYGQDAAVVGIDPSGGNFVGVLIYQTTRD